MRFQVFNDLDRIFFREHFFQHSLGRMRVILDAREKKRSYGNKIDQRPVRFPVVWWNEVQKPCQNRCRDDGEKEEEPDVSQPHHDSQHEPAHFSKTPRLLPHHCRHQESDEEEEYDFPACLMKINRHPFLNVSDI